LEGTFGDHPVQLLLPKQGHLEQAAQDHIQVRFEYLQRRRLHNLSGQPVPVLCHPQRKKFFLIFSWIFLCNKDINFALLTISLMLNLESKRKSSTAWTEKL